MVLWWVEEWVLPNNHDSRATWLTQKWSTRNNVQGHIWSVAIKIRSLSQDPGAVVLRGPCLVKWQEVSVNISGKLPYQHIIDSFD